MARSEAFSQGKIQLKSGRTSTDWKLQYFILEFYFSAFLLFLYSSKNISPAGSFTLYCVLDSLQ